MATFRAIHPLVREMAFKFGFEPVPGDGERVKHPGLKGKRAQAAFYRAFDAASRLPGVQRVRVHGKPNDTTLRFPDVPESRWEAARRGVPWNSNAEFHGKVGDLIKRNLARQSRVMVTESPHPSPVRPRDFRFNGLVDQSGCLSKFEVETTDEGTARTLLGALRLS